VTGYIGVFGDCRGFIFEKPHPGNPYRAWTACSYWGFGGFISTTGNFFKIDLLYRLVSIRVTRENNFQRLKRTIKPPETPFLFSGTNWTATPLLPKLSATGSREATCGELRPQQYGGWGGEITCKGMERGRCDGSYNDLDECRTLYDSNGTTPANIPEFQALLKSDKLRYKNSTEPTGGTWATRSVSLTALCTLQLTGL
jgi:hypothetical protein